MKPIRQSLLLATLCAAFFLSACGDKAEQPGLPCGAVCNWFALRTRRGWRPHLGLQGLAQQRTRRHVVTPKARAG